MLNPLVALPFIPPGPVLSELGSDSCCGEANMGAGGVEAFIELSDAPNSYAGQAHKLVAVNETETGVEFVDNSSSGWRPAIRVGRDNAKWTPNDYTYTDTLLAGVVFFVYYNGVKILTPELEGFAILGRGGFTFDPAKFQFYTGEYLYLIF